MRVSETGHEALQNDLGAALLLEPGQLSAWACALKVSEKLPLEAEVDFDPESELLTMNLVDHRGNSEIIINFLSDGEIHVYLEGCTSPSWVGTDLHQLAELLEA